MGAFITLFAIYFFMLIATSKVHQTKQTRIIQCLFCTALLVGIQGLRHESIGVDSYNTYRPFFEIVSSGMTNLLDRSDVMFGFEPGFVIFTKLFKTICDNTQAFILFCSLIACAPIGFIIYKYAENIPLAFIIFSCFVVYHFGFSGIRQAIAIGITVVAFECVVRKQLPLFLLFTMLASAIHSSAILFLIVYPLYHKIQLTPKSMFLLAIVFMIGLTFMRPLIISLTELIFGGEKYMHKAMENAVPSYNLMILLAFFLLFTFKNNDSKIIPFRTMLLMAVLFQSLGLVSSSASRMAYYFLPYLSIALPLSSSRMKQRHTIELVIAVFFIFFFFYSYSGGYLDVIPYKFFWEE